LLDEKKEEARWMTTETSNLGTRVKGLSFAHNTWGMNFIFTSEKFQKMK
jgi:hypothetical protein